MLLLRQPCLSFLYILRVITQKSAIPWCISTLTKGLGTQEAADVTSAAESGSALLLSWAAKGDIRELKPGAVWIPILEYILSHRGL